MTLPQPTYHIICKSSAFCLFNDVLRIKNTRIGPQLTIYRIYFELKTSNRCSSNLKKQNTINPNYRIGLK